MEQKTESAPSSTALLLIDVINDFDFPEGDALFAEAWPAARVIASLKQRAKAARVPVIYVNDNFGRWRSHFPSTVEHCVQEGCRGKPIAELLAPDEDDYFVLKPKHSGFYSTALSVLLEYLGATTLILTGFAGNICVLFTAHDAHMRDFWTIVPRDCCASNTRDENESALRQLERVVRSDTRPSREIDFDALARKPAR